MLCAMFSAEIGTKVRLRVAKKWWDAFVPYFVSYVLCAVRSDQNIAVTDIYLTFNLFSYNMAFGKALCCCVVHFWC